MHQPLWFLVSCLHPSVLLYLSSFFFPLRNVETQIRHVEYRHTTTDVQAGAAPACILTRGAAGPRRKLGLRNTPPTGAWPGWLCCALCPTTSWGRFSVIGGWGKSEPGSFSLFLTKQKHKTTKIINFWVCFFPAKLLDDLKTWIDVFFSKSF